jgi:hypothetical protein
MTTMKKKTGCFQIHFEYELCHPVTTRTFAILYEVDIVHTFDRICVILQQFF